MQLKKIIKLIQIALRLFGNRTNNFRAANAMLYQLP